MIEPDTLVFNEERLTEIKSRWDDLRSRAGKFRVSRELMFTAHPDDLLALFSNMIIVKAEAEFVSDSIEYTAFSPLFDQIPETTLTPHYSILVTRREGAPLHFAFTRLPF